MDVAAQMLEAHPQPRGVDHATLAIAIEALNDVVTAATSCADACLAESNVADMVDCARACQDAADVAGALARVLARTGPTPQGTRSLVNATAKLLGEAGAIADRHGQHDKHCRISAETITRGQQALASLEAAVAAAQA